ncbi:NAD-dependent protein deacylase sirtuin-5, mitochondrial-like isoform X2 [Mytilus californianus]|uniref:NAD-dependent protein deacylase sirtuin-5, mitochondrial-like isoform X2 n=1 Tax=Mytilus californianus TaxID=6549 RepID=UPI002247AFE0|nr:NAD-dependent protein deacylase sirtuin-5, mitochondrial-like isoform X2 [Mytilus californianus]
MDKNMALKNWDSLDNWQKFDMLGLIMGITTTATFPPSTSIPKFREDFAKAKHIVVVTGAGVSAESGVPTFRGPGGYWRNKKVQELATVEHFEKNPSLSWQFYHHRREGMVTKLPNKAHFAIAECEKRLKSQGRRVVVITQNIDELHKRAGSENILEMHGSLFKIRCTKCQDVTENTDSPICPALAGKGAPDLETEEDNIPLDKLPRCKKTGCGGLMRPHVVWFGESLDPSILAKAEEELEKCDLCLLVGTSSVVRPVALFGPRLSILGIPVAEFNTEETPVTKSLGYHFQGPACTLIPEALARHESEPE